MCLQREWPKKISVITWEHQILIRILCAGDQKMFYFFYHIALGYRNFTNVNFWHFCKRFLQLYGSLQYFSGKMIIKKKLQVIQKFVRAWGAWWSATEVIRRDSNEHIVYQYQSLQNNCKKHLSTGHQFEELFINVFFTQLEYWRSNYLQLCVKLNLCTPR